MPNRFRFSLVALATTTLAVSAARAAPINVGVKFLGDNNSSLAAASVAGLPVAQGGSPQANWNNEGGATGTANALKASDGSSTFVGVTWNATTLFNANAESNTDQLADQAGNTVGADKILMSGYLDQFTSSTNVVTITGLNPAVTNYGVIVYSLASVPGRGGQPVTVTGLATQSGNVVAAVSTAYVSGTNYIQFSNVQPNAAGQIIIGGTAGGAVTRLPIQGVQVLGVPEPASLGLLGAGSLLLLGRRRTR